MAYLMLIVAAVFLAVLARLGVGALGGAAEALLLTPWFWLWSQGRQASVAYKGLLVAAFYFDVLSPRMFPLNLGVSLLAGVIFLIMVAPALWQGALFMRLLALLLWLLLWRFVRLGLLAALWFIGFEPLPPVSLAWQGIVGMLAVGLGVWGLLEAGRWLLGRWFHLAR